ENDRAMNFSPGGFPVPGGLPLGMLHPLSYWRQGPFVLLSPGVVRCDEVAFARRLALLFSIEGAASGSAVIEASMDFHSGRHIKRSIQQSGIAYDLSAESRNLSTLQGHEHERGERIVTT